jgi:20S proteasome alpha/beta subunit
MLTSSSRVVHQVGSQCIMGCLGLDSDSHILLDSMRKKLASHEDLELEPHSIARCVSNILYEKGLYLTPLIAGLDDKRQPYICSMDGLGSQVVTRDFAVSGTASGTLFAICEAQYQGGLEQDELVALAKRCFSLAMQRDVMSGGECKVFLLSRRGVGISAFITDDAW